MGKTAIDDTLVLGIQERRGGGRGRRGKKRRGRVLGEERWRGEDRNEGSRGEEVSALSVSSNITRIK